MKRIFSFILVSFLSFYSLQVFACKGDKPDCELLPVADFTFKVKEGEQDEISFDAISSYARGENTIEKFTWEFGDGKTEFKNKDPKIEHKYSVIFGKFKVTLTVKDDKGNEGKVTKLVDFNLSLYQLSWENQDFPSVLNAPDEASFNEAEGTITVNLLLNIPIFEETRVEIGYISENSTATHLNDFQGANFLLEKKEEDFKTAIITIPSGATKYPVEISIVGDKVPEINEVIHLKIIRVVNSDDINITPIETIKITIVDDDLGQPSCDGATGSYHLNPDTTEGCFVADTAYSGTGILTLPAKETGCQVCGTSEIVSNGSPVTIEGFLSMTNGSRIVGESLNSQSPGITLKGEISLDGTTIADHVYLEGKISIENSQIGLTSEDEVTKIIGDVIIESSIISQQAKIEGNGKIKGSSIHGEPKITGDINVQSETDFTGINITGEASIGPNVKIIGSLILISESAKVTGNSSIDGDSIQINNNAEVAGNSSLRGGPIFVRDNAKVLDNVQIKSSSIVFLSENAIVFGDAILYDETFISGSARVFSN
ncbi:MAG: PKD repeat protein, partial [Bacteriovoracaceae bacterium]